MFCQPSIIPRCVHLLSFSGIILEFVFKKSRHKCMGGAASIEALPRLASAERTYLVEWAEQTGLARAKGQY